MDNTIAKTLKNCPFTDGGFRLEVIQTTAANWFVQKLHPHSDVLHIYYRSYQGGKFLPWQSVASEEWVNNSSKAVKIIQKGSFGNTSNGNLVIDFSNFPSASGFLFICYRKIAHIMRWSQTIEYYEIGEDSWEMTTSGLVITCKYSGTRYYSLIQIT